MHDAICEKQISLNNPSLVHEERIGGERNGKIAALERREHGAVEKLGAVGDAVERATIDNVIGQQGFEVAGRHRRQGGAETLDGIVVRNEKGKVGSLRKEIRHVCYLGSTAGSSNIEGWCAVYEALRGFEKGIDDL